MTYDAKFFQQRHKRALNDAAEIAFETRLAIGHVPATIVDFGCADGALLQVWRELGCKCVVGIDPHGPETWRVQNAEGKQVLGEGATHLRLDLARPIGFEERMALAICLEVGEHLPPEAAPTLVDSLCNTSDRVLFSAARPGQGGEGHINEQPLAYWRELFTQRGYVQQDIVRWRLSGDVSWWYRKNIILFCKQGSEIEVPQYELLMPCYGTAGTDRAKHLNQELSARLRWLSARGMRVPGAGNLRVVGGQACIDKARGELASCFMDERIRQSPYSLWLDDDMVPDTQRDLIDLLVAAHYTGRLALGGFAPKKILPSTIAHSFSLWGQTLVGPGAPQQPFDSLGFGIIVVAREAFELVDAWSAANPHHPWAVKPTMSGPRKPIRDYFRPILGEPDPRFMDLDTGEWKRAYFNEDGSFCKRLQKAGGELWAMPQSFPGHQGTFTFRKEHVE
jgi:hypothetical protein